MKYLIDTHVCIWALAAKQNLSPKVKAILEDTEINILVSPISFFEIAIKLKTGKLPDFNYTLSEFIKSVELAGFELLPFKNEHLTNYSFIEFSPDHRDPFDRYLIAAAEFEKMSILTKDEKFKLYNGIVEIVWQ